MLFYIALQAMNHNLTFVLIEWFIPLRILSYYLKNEETQLKNTWAFIKILKPSLNTLLFQVILEPSLTS
jgi:hypothetical protein